MSTVPNQRLVSPKPAVGAAMPRDTSPWQLCLQHRQPSLLGPGPPAGAGHGAWPWHMNSRRSVI